MKPKVAVDEGKVVITDYAKNHAEDTDSTSQPIILLYRWGKRYAMHVGDAGFPRIIRWKPCLLETYGLLLRWSSPAIRFPSIWSQMIPLSGIACPGTGATTTAPTGGGREVKKMDCLNCSLLKKAKEEIKTLQRDQDMAFLLLEIVAATAEDYRKKLIQHVGKDAALTESIDFDGLVERLRNRSTQAAVELDQDTLKATLDKK